MHSTIFRPPAVPLICHDPYFSIWSNADRLSDGFTTHWTGEQHPLTSLVRIDGQTFRLMGAAMENMAVLDQESLRVLPTRTVYTFRHPSLRLELTFLTPCMPHDLDHFAWPLTYIIWKAASTDGREHDVQVYFDAYADLAVDSWERRVVWARFNLSGLEVLRVGNFNQPILERPGDFTRIDWGYLYLAAPRQPGCRSCLTTAEQGSSRFRSDGRLPENDDLRMPRQVRLHKKIWQDSPVLACALDLGRVGAQACTSFLMLAYDELYSVEYFQRRLRPFWRRYGREMDSLLETARSEFDTLQSVCAAYDEDLMRDLESAGGPRFAELAALSFRQCVAGHSLAVDLDGRPLHFSKENTSNGCIATVDVAYPGSPFFLLLNPALLEAQLRPILDYSASSLWPHPFAPHDIGTHPQANGQVYRGGVHTSEQMPVEECGNMLVLVSAHSLVSPASDLAAGNWKTLLGWAEYLAVHGYDPANQLCTDDFAGPMPRNTNLSLKAIVALGAFARLCDTLDRREEARRFDAIARDMAARWSRDANDGDHYRLAFDRPGTWSLKYNLIWDKVLGLGLFPAEIYRKELNWYRSKLNLFGVPLDNRSDYTKLDWQAWAAALADSREEKFALLDPLAEFAGQTPDRVPLSDWYYTSSARFERFKARSVVGGVFMPMLTDKKLWARWRERQVIPAAR